MYRGRLARVVDHMVDRAVIAERHGDHVVEPYLRALRRLDCPGQPDIRIDEDAVHTQPPRLMRRHSIRHFLGALEVLEAPFLIGVLRPRVALKNI